MKLNTLHQPGPSFIEYKTYVLGVTEGANGASDFTAASTSQTITLDSLNPGDIVILPECRVDVLTDIAHAAATWKLMVGITGTTARFIPDTDLLAGALVAQGGTLVGTLEANLVPYARQGSSSAVDVVATITVASSTVAATTAGRLAITLAIIRRADRIKNLLPPA